jgi:serine/threonine-protein kinase
VATRLRVPPLAARAFAVTAAVVAAVLLAALAAASSAARRDADADATRGLEQAADLTAQLLAGRGRALAGGARVFVQGPYFRALVAGQRRDDLLDQAFEAAEQLEAAWVFITDERGVLLAKSDEPGASGAPLGAVPLVAGALEGRETSGFGASRDTLLFQTVCLPIVVPGGAPVGTLTATRVVDERLARDVRAATGAEVVFYTVDPAGRRRVAASTLGRAQADALVADAGAGAGRWRRQQAALVTAGGEVVGGYVVLREAAGVPSGLAAVRRSLLGAGALGLGLALVVAWLAARVVARPARALAGAARAAVRGEYAPAALAARGVAARGARDELGDLAAAFDALLAELRGRELLVGVVGGATPGEPAPPPGDAGRREPPSEPRPPRARGRWRRSPHGHARPALALAPGETVAGRYLVQAEVGRGGAGVVYRALDRLVGERVALKVLRPEVLDARGDARARLAQELRLARRVSHRNVVRTHDLAEHAGVPFVTMEYVEGASLRAVLRARGPLDERAAAALAAQLARAVAAAHEQGVVHGDLKPENLLVRVDGLLKVTDFGVASLARHGPAAPAAPGERRIAGAIVGTPEYLAPEVLLGARPDAGADLYAMGVVLGECLTGGTPFQVDTPRAFLARKLDAPAPAAPPDGPPGTLAGLAAWLTAADRAARPRSAAEVVAALARLGPR